MMKPRFVDGNKLQIDTKREFYRLQKLGYFNSLRVWETEKELLEARSNGFNGLIGLRYSGEPGNPYIHNLRISEAVERSRGFQKQNLVKFYEASNDQFITIQGEVQRGLYGYDLRVSSDKTHQRKALLNQRFFHGAEALYILRSQFSLASWEHLQWIFETFPDHIVEFTAYSISVGQLNGHNVVIWEVRNY